MFLSTKVNRIKYNFILKRHLFKKKKKAQRDRKYCEILGRLTLNHYLS